MIKLFKKWKIKRRSKKSWELLCKEVEELNGWIDEISGVPDIMKGRPYGK